MSFAKRQREAMRAARRAGRKGAPELKMELYGAKELEASLRDLPKSIGKKTVERAAFAALEPVAEDARGRVRKRSGLLARLISVSKHLSRRQKRAARGSNRGMVSVYVGAAPAKRAHLTEFGTGPRQHKSGKSTGQARPFPFLRPAWEQNKDRVLEIFKRMLGVEIEKSAERIRRKQMRAVKKAGKG